MQWEQVLAIIAANLSMFLWATRQARADFLHLDKKLDDHRKETTQIVKAIQEEIKDFHNRMCAIEEKNKK